MIIRFSDEEIRHLQIRYVERLGFCEDYLAEREEIWHSRLGRVQANGGTLWNGEIYTIEDLLPIDETQVVILLGTCEYKDIVFRVEKGLQYIADRFGSDHIPKWITVDCIPITQDGKFVFGFRHDGMYAKSKPLGLIGGIANRDEMEIVAVGDFWRYMVLEIQQETRFDCQPENLRLFSLNAFRGKYEFLFTWPIPCLSSEIENMAREGEFSKLIALSLEQVLTNSRPSLDAFRYCKNYLHELQSVDA